MKIKDVEVPEIGLGTWQLTGKTCSDAVRIALKLGYKHIDTAAFYGNHKDVREGMKDHDRTKIFITSKVFPTNLSYSGVMNACNKALSELGTDYLDLYLIHWPNPLFPMKNTFKALLELKEKGKIRNYGVSNFTIKNLTESMEFGDIFTNQVEFHPFLYQRKLLEYCNENRITLTAYSPIARGKVYQDEIIGRIAKRHKKSCGQVSLRWLLDKNMIVIPKASSKEHLKENLEVFDFKLTKEDTDILDNLPKHRLVNFGFKRFDD